MIRCARRSYSESIEGQGSGEALQDVEQRSVEQLENEIREVARVAGDFLSEGFEGHLRCREDEERAEQDEIQEIDHDKGEERTVGGEIRLALGNHPEGEAKMESPSQPEKAEEDRCMGLEVVEDANNAVRSDNYY